MRRKPPGQPPSWEGEKDREHPSSDGQPLVQSKFDGAGLTQAFDTLGHHYHDRPDVEVRPDGLVRHERGTNPGVAVWLGGRATDR